MHTSSTTQIYIKNTLSSLLLVYLFLGRSGRNGQKNLGHHFENITIDLHCTHHTYEIEMASVNKADICDVIGKHGNNGAALKMKTYRPSCLANPVLHE